MPMKRYSKMRLMERLLIGHKYQISSQSLSRCRYFDSMAELVYKLYVMFSEDERSMDNAAGKYLPQGIGNKHFRMDHSGEKAVARREQQAYIVLI